MNSSELAQENESKGKRTKFLVRVNPRPSLPPNQQHVMMPVAIMFACLYIFLNVVSKAEMMALMASTMPRNLGEVAVGAAEEPAGLVAVDPGHRMLRAVGSIYNKNSNPMVREIADHEWEEHAFLPIPSLQVAEDPDHIWPALVEKEEKPKANKKK